MQGNQMSCRPVKLYVRGGKGLRGPQGAHKHTRVSAILGLIQCSIVEHLRPQVCFSTSHICVGAVCTSEG